MAIKRKRTFKKRTFKKRSRKRSRRTPGISARRGRTSMVRSLGPVLPQKFKRTLKYVTLVGMDGLASGLCSNYIMRAGSCYDPEQPVGGHQPRGFDQIHALFHHSTVIASRIVITADSSTLALASSLWIRLSPNAVGSNSPTDFDEGGYTASTLVHPNRPTTLSMNCNPNKFLSTKPMADNRRQSATTNPAEDCYFVISTAAFNRSDNPPSFPLRIQMEYVVVFSEPLAPEQG